ncbi:hypothetical protein AKJ08_1149 [Vulgatibacter incomptus]|uniref:DUF1648 domain-containing protein n=1 Tax=Vulgatibacter incomptus TaxID=1391653 RepID=A0A0K1PB96_9BACT|nr:hypothetical protein AKJ08_1149 [Vulgatibacter incomptus]
MTAILVGCAVMFHFLPRLQRPTLFFAVTVPPGYRDAPEARRILAQYRRRNAATSLAALALALFASFAEREALGPAVHMWMATAAVLLQLLGALGAFLAARHRVLPDSTPPSPVREAALAPRPRKWPGGWIAQLGPFLILAAVAGYLVLHWDQIPDRFPTHWGAGGVADRWGERSFRSVYAPLILGAAQCAMLILIAFGTLRWSRSVSASGAQAEREWAFRRLIVLILLGTEYFLALLFGFIALLPLRASAHLPGGFLAFMALELVLVVLVIVFLARMGQGGTRQVPATAEAGGAPVGDKTLDRYWKLGIFYVNPSDPAIFVEKRFGLGYTLNFARPLSWLLLLLPIAISVVTIVATRPR